MKELKNIQEIVNYLEGNMTDQEMEELEIRALLNPSFQNDIQTTKTLIRGIKESGKETTKEEKIQKLQDNPVAQLDEEKKEDEASGAKIIQLRRYRKRLFYPLAVVASFAVLVITAQLVFFPSPLTPEQIFAANFEVAPNNVVTPSRDAEEKKPPIWSAYQAYDNQKFAEAAALFEQTIDKSEYRITDLFHLGNCYLVLEEWDQAITALEEVVNAQTSKSEEAKWYQALAYLRVGENEKAKLLLEKITDSERTKQVRKILKKLE